MNVEGKMCCLCNKRDFFWVDMFSLNFCQSCATIVSRIYRACPAGAVFTYDEHEDYHYDIRSWGRPSISYREQVEILTGKVVPQGTVYVTHESTESIVSDVRDCDQPDCEVERNQAAAIRHLGPASEGVCRGVR